MRLPVAPDLTPIACHFVPLIALTNNDEDQLASAVRAAHGYLLLQQARKPAVWRSLSININGQLAPG